MINIILIIFII